MGNNLITIDKGIYESLEGELVKLRERVSDLEEKLCLREVDAKAASCLLTTQDYDNSINTVLAELGKATAVDRIYIFENSSHPLTKELFLSQRWEWVADGVSKEQDYPLLQNLSYNNFSPLWYEQLRYGNSIITVEDKSQFQGSRSIFIIPIQVKGKWWGFIGFEDYKSLRQFSDAQKSILQAFAVNLGGAIARHETLDELRKLNKELQHRVEERALLAAETETRFKRLAANVPGMLYQYRLNPNGDVRFSYVSDGCRELFGVEPEQIRRNSDILMNMIHHKDVAGFNQSIADCIPALKNWEYEWRIITPSKKVKWLQGFSRLEKQPDGTIFSDGCVIDVTERKLAEFRSQEQEQFLRSVYDGSEHIIFVVDVLEDNDFLHQGWNSACERATGMKSENVKGKTLEEIFGEVKGAEVRQRYRNCLEANTSISYEECLEFGGIPSWWLTTLNSLKNTDGKVYRLVGTTFNITERKKVEAEIQTKQHFIQRITDSSPSTIYIYDLEKQQNIYTNHEIAAILGYSSQEIQEMGKNLFQRIIHPEDLAKVASGFEKIAAGIDGEIYESEYRVKQVDGKYRWLYSRDTIFTRNQNGKVTQFLGVATDITERKLAEIELQNTLYQLQTTQTQLIQSEKMSSLGQMVAGVAHEINNPVNFIHGNVTPASQYAQDVLNLLELYQQHYPNPPLYIQEEIEAVDLEFLKQDFIKILDSMKQGTQRIREIVLSLRNFSRLDEAEFKAVDIHEGIDSTLMILQNRLKAKPNFPEIKIVKNYAPLPPIDCFPSQLNQVLMNILANAIDALESQKSLTTPQIQIHTKLLEDNRVAIHLSDNGSGIPLQIQSKLFDPFFTTKEVGKGTGLGLSISYQIVVNKHGGNLSCKSIPGEGTEFRIEIPVFQTNN